MPSGFEVNQVIGSGSAQELICQTIDLCAHVEEIKEIRKTVIIDRCHVVFDKVIIDGRLRKDIMFKEAHKGFPVPGTVQGCVGRTATIKGNIGDLDVDFAFTAMIPVPGAKPGDMCVVLQAFVEGEAEEPADLSCDGTFSSLIDKSIVFLCVKVVRDVVIHGFSDGDSGGRPLCPERRSTGFYPGGHGKIPGPRPGPLPGSWVGPTLIFPGVLNPGIPTTIPPMNKTVATSDSQIQIAKSGIGHDDH